MRKISDNTTKNMGRFYTPSELAKILTSNAIVSKSQKVLDPSCGHGSLLNAAYDVLRNLGSESPERQLFGVDIDSDAIDYLETHPNRFTSMENLLACDFMTLRKDALPGAPFDVILCNPPYTRHHEISDRLLKSARDSMKCMKIQLPRTSGYWAYFVVHSMSFLKIGGRMSMLLPLALLEALYSKKTQREVECRFEKVEVHILRPGYFKEILEHVILLDADGYLGPDAQFEGHVQTTLNGLDGRGNTSSRKPPSIRGWDLKGVLLSCSILDTLEKAKSNTMVLRLGEYFKVRIGVVTGANDYFILTSSEVDEFRLQESHLAPIIANTPLLRGLRFTDRDWKKARDADKRVHMIRTLGMKSLPTQLKAYLSTVESDRVRDGYHCRNRNPWHSIKHIDKPDAFFHYMLGKSPHIVLNTSEATCTNTIHRLFERSSSPRKEVRTLSVSSITSLSALSSEILGRGMGGGLLKLEPSAVENILLANPPERISYSTWKEVDGLLRTGQLEVAMDTADDEILLNQLDMKKKAVRELRRGYEHLRNYRLNKRKRKRT